MKAIAGIIIAALACFWLVVGGVWYTRHLRTELEIAETKINTLQREYALARKAEASAMAARQVENEKAKRREQLMENILCVNPDWRDIVVPDDVARMLEQGAAGSDCLSATGDASQ